MLHCRFVWVINQKRPQIVMHLRLNKNCFMLWLFYVSVVLQFIWYFLNLTLFATLRSDWCFPSSVADSSSTNGSPSNFRSSTLCVTSAGITSFFNGLVVFTLLGFMAKHSGMDITSVAAQSGNGIICVCLQWTFTNPHTCFITLSLQVCLYNKPNMTVKLWLFNDFEGYFSYFPYSPDSLTYFTSQSML